MAAKGGGVASPKRVVERPLIAIEDKDSYQAVIEVLDYLFDLGDRRTAEELTWYRSLARLAHQYELDHGGRVG